MIDMTKGKPSKLILYFAFPMILGNIFQQVYNLVDTIVVGKFIGSNALAAVGSSFAIIVFITSIIIGLSMGVSVLLSQFYGAKELEKMKETIITATIVIGFVTIILMIVSLMFIDNILALFNMPQQLIEDSKSYLIIILVGLLFTYVYNLGTALLRAIGDSKRPLYFLIISSVINIFLDLIFVINLNLGVKGVALATIIAQGVSAILVVIYISKKVTFIKFTIKDIKFKKESFLLVIRYSVLTSIQQSIMNLGILIVQGLVNSFGVVVMAAFAAAVKIDSFAYMPVQDFGNAFSTYVAQNKGANLEERIIDGIKSAGKVIITTSLVLIFSKNLMLLFVNKGESEVIRIGVEYISIVAIFYFLIGFLFMFYGLFRGLGELKTSILLTIASLGTRVILAYILAETILMEKGIWFSVPIGWALADTIGIIFLNKYKKSRNRMIVTKK